MTSQSFKEFYAEFKKHPDSAKWEEERRAKQLLRLEENNPRTCPICEQNLLQPHPNCADFFEEDYQCIGCGAEYTPPPPSDPRGLGQSWMETDCQLCDNARQQEAEDAGRPLSEWISSRMILCPECGNKRCPKATWHENTCTGSNESGQKGSSYE